MFSILLKDAIAHEEWKNPGYKALKILLDLGENEAKLMLFETREIMETVNQQLDAAGYVDDPEFCMIRDISERHGLDDPRLIYSQALFIGGATSPGEDVLLAVDVSKPSDEQTVFWFDWSRKIPHRWKPIMSLSSFLDALCTVEKLDTSCSTPRKSSRFIPEEDFF
ncbi:MAG: hypothetical protein JW902_07320 [Syntrophaceae bacterium]|nr:hypothetical protein [Syntrophaceae bacterium]